MRPNAIRTFVATAWLLLPTIGCGQPEPAQPGAPLQYYIDSLYLSVPDTSLYDPADYCTIDSARVVVDTVGYLNGHLIVELQYSCTDTIWCDVGKAILYQMEAEHYRLLYTNFSDCTQIVMKPAYVIDIDSTEVLCTRCPIMGSGGYVDERYWVWDTAVSEPVDLKAPEATCNALSAVLPKGYSLAWGGFFDIAGLSLDCYVRKPGDVNASPTGGKVSIRYQIDGHALKVVSCQYDPHDIDSADPPPDN